MWIDIAGLIFVCVTMNHLGLIRAVEQVTGYTFKILGCVKCASFWAVLIYASCIKRGFIASLAVSFLASYVAIWLELFEGFVDVLFAKEYEKIYPASDNDTDSSDADNGHSAGSVS